jgi:hypothetical protein
MKEHYERFDFISVRSCGKKPQKFCQSKLIFNCFQNNLGAKRENVTLGVGPAPAEYHSHKYIQNILYIDWMIKSRQQLTELQILYRNNEVRKETDF